MQFEQFIEQVKEEGKLSSRDDALRITEATLETLGERLYRTERVDLGAQLPGELKDFLFKRQEPEPTNRRHTDRYLLQEFFNRVGARAGTGYYDAAQRARAVMHVLRQAVSPGALDKALDGLPDEYRELAYGNSFRGPGFPSLDNQNAE
jgi:uncharacterized protein (DUF2267 family)